MHSESLEYNNDIYFFEFLWSLEILCVSSIDTNELTSGSSDLISYNLNIWIVYGVVFLVICLCLRTLLIIEGSFICNETHGSVNILHIFHM